MPTSSKDPYALRRSALGILRIIIENNLKIKLNEIFHDEIIKKYNLSDSSNLDIKNLIIFFIERFRFFLKSVTKRQDIVNAFFIDKSFSSDFLTLYKKFLALNKFINKNEGKKIIELNKRALNIVTIESKKMDINKFIDKDLETEKYEKDLIYHLDNVMVNVNDPKIKKNRLSILKEVINTLKVYADFSKIQK